MPTGSRSWVPAGLECLVRPQDGGSTAPSRSVTRTTPATWRVSLTMRFSVDQRMTLPVSVTTPPATSTVTAPASVGKKAPSTPATTSLRISSSVRR
jgi:hypothetical protein